MFEMFGYFFRVQSQKFTSISPLENGLLRTSEGCTGPEFSLILDVKCVKFTVIANEPENSHCYYMHELLIQM